MKSKKNYSSPELYMAMYEYCDVLAISTPDAEDDPFGFESWEV